MRSEIDKRAKKVCKSWAKEKRLDDDIHVACVSIVVKSFPLIEKVRGEKKK